MNKLIRNLFIAGATAALFAASASAATIMVNGVGSSAQFQTASLAAAQLAGAGFGHYTAKNAGQIVDSREPGIPNELGNLSVVWNSAQTQVWVYLSVDSVVGNRAYFAQPRTTLALTSPLPAPGQLISSAFWGADVTIPAGVQTLISGAQFNAAYTDILPADAKFAQNRVNCGPPSTVNLGCLGYNTADPNVGTAIQSAITAGTVAHPINFNIYGNDPITNTAIPAATIVPVGITPIIFIVNRKNASGLGQPWVGPVGECTDSSSNAYCFNDITYQSTAQLLFTGVDCAGTAWGPYDAVHFFAVSPIQREPLSGTMNTFEFNFMVQNGQGLVSGGYFSQESVFNSPYFVPSTFGPIPAATNNPLNGECGGPNGYASSPQGKRMRSVGTGDEVKGVTNNVDSIGYLFFGYGNVSSIAGSPSYGYLNYQLVDPINPSGSYLTPYTSPTGNLVYPGNGELPTCTAPCAIPPGASFPNIRNGAYKGWSVLRAVADTGSVALTNLQALATQEANQVNSTQPDYLPFNAAADGDPGFIAYRIHFDPNPSPTGTGITGGATFTFNAGDIPNNGITVPADEAGGDVGGCLQYKTVPNSLGCRY